jgi:hypothetical protein
MTEENDRRSVLMLLCRWWYRRHASVSEVDLPWRTRLGERPQVVVAGIRKPYALSSQLELQRKPVRRLEVSFYELFAP